ncbi:hypothetical protein BBO99_00006495 [Phytophthora kernoviae]|uniref:Chitin-binding type-4 domain-containing protein n=2 Tax=Phytophthora kernoviae TaxID=325452 RepID=A0A3R7G9J4_9STRA|nr:hypothetical protein G195_010190 [Phytophthora kernoviae 00238/432]KAG2508208.1 hypothetical protein JM16_008843 [Phytophthora kernoviae]KAG2510649.1 hypothetical protein JM18_008518 [Phytophthora kernoviae]RLN45889.1 hypothetical protein BBI17_006543 [Phytophthora kernoviae]RLN77764.1 hypothetical protein BBO99_00006495 [Phytophthora kernoviae]
MKFLSLMSLTLGAHLVNGHGYLSQPAASFQGGSVITKYETLITESCDPAFAGLKWDDNPEANTATFASALPNSHATSSMKWQNDQEMMGFIDSHHGPCEAWIDGSDGSSTRVFQSDDCRRDYPGYPAEIPIDFSTCNGDCTFTFYWLALHEPNWQVYKQCAPIVNGGNTESRNALGTATPHFTNWAATTSTPTVLMSAEDTDAGTTAPMDPAFTAISRCRTRRRQLRANLRSDN